MDCPSCAPNPCRCHLKGVIHDTDEGFILRDGSQAHPMSRPIPGSNPPEHQFCLRDHVTNLPCSRIFNSQKEFCDWLLSEHGIRFVPMVKAVNESN